MIGSLPFTIRRATAADAEAICKVHIESIRVACAADYTAEQIEAWAGRKRPEHYVDAMREGELMFVAEAAGEIIGFAALRGDEIRAIYVAPDALRRGVGKALLAAIEAEAIAHGIDLLRLESTTTAERFYAAQGFSRGGPTVHRMSGVDIPCVTMTKRLRDITDPAADCAGST